METIKEYRYIKKNYNRGNVLHDIRITVDEFKRMFPNLKENIDYFAYVIACPYNNQQVSHSFYGIKEC